MFHSLDFRNVHQPPKSFFIKDFSVRGKHWSQLEGQHVRVSPARCPISRRFLGGGFPVQPAGLKQNWNSALSHNGIHLLAVEFDDVSWLPFDIGAAYKLRVGAQSFSGQIGRASCRERVYGWGTARV